MTVNWWGKINKIFEQVVIAVKGNRRFAGRGQECQDFQPQRKHELLKYSTFELLLICDSGISLCILYTRF